jgi:Glycosyl transferase family 2
MTRKSPADMRVRFRLPPVLPARPAPYRVATEAPVVAVIPVHDEEATVAQVVGGLPRSVQGRHVVAVVVDDGSTDRSAELARAAGAVVVTQPRNMGLGAAVRRGLGEANVLFPAAVVYLDADLEYEPAELPVLAAPVLDGSADYVVGSRFAGEIRRMLPRRRAGNRLLTAWVRWMTRQHVTDGQSGYRAFSPRAAAQAEIIHDYNCAQVLTLDLLGKGFVYREVPISYAFREVGTSFVRLGRYLRRVLPAVLRELNRSVLDDMAFEALAGGGPGVAVEPSVVTERVDGVVGHDQRMMGVVVREQTLPAERHNPTQHPRPGVDAGEVVLESLPVDRIHLAEPASLDVDPVDSR